MIANIVPDCLVIARKHRKRQPAHELRVAKTLAPRDTLSVDLDANAILASILIGTVGLGVFIYGKRQGRFPHMLAGVGLMAYPYFVSNVLLQAGIAMALLAALWLVVRLGW